MCDTCVNKHEPHLPVESRPRRYQLTHYKHHQWRVNVGILHYDIIWHHYTTTRLHRYYTQLNNITNDKVCLYLCVCVCVWVVHGSVHKEEGLGFRVTNLAQLLLHNSSDMHTHVYNWYSRLSHRPVPHSDDVSSFFRSPLLWCLGGLPWRQLRLKRSWVASPPPWPALHSITVYHI